MSELGEGGEMIASFQVAYEGHTDAVHSMDVQLLAPALLGLGDVIREANRVMNGEKSSVKLLVQSDFEHKCFNVNLDLIMSFYESVKTALGLAHEIKNAHEVLEWLGILGGSTGAGAGGLGLFAYLKKRRGRKINSVTKLDTTDTTSIAARRAFISFAKRMPWYSSTCAQPCTTFPSPIKRYGSMSSSSVTGSAGMAKSPPKTEPGAQERFEQAVDYMLKTKPKPHAPLKKKKRAKKKK